MDYQYWDLVVNWGRLIATLLAIIGGAWLAHRNWKKQKKIENQIKKDEIQYSNRAEAAKAVWALLEYLSELEHPKTIIVKRGTPEKTISYCRLDRAIEFTAAIPEILYHQGHGAFLTSEVEKKLMALRGKFYRIVESVLRAEVRNNPELQEQEEEIFQTLDGFAELIRNGNTKMTKIKNPKFIQQVAETRDHLKSYLQSQLSLQ